MHAVSIFTGFSFSRKKTVLTVQANTFENNARFMR